MGLFSKPEIVGSELQKCLAYYEASLSITAFQTREADLFNNTLVKYLNAATEDPVAAREVCNAANRLVQAAKEMIRRHEGIQSIPEAASSLRQAYRTTFLAYAAWAEATLSAMEGLANGMTPPPPYCQFVQHLLDQCQSAWCKAQTEDKKFLKRLRVSVDIIEKIINRCNTAGETDSWQRLRDVQAYRASGDAHRRKLEQDLAIVDYTKAIEIAPEFAPAYCDRGRANRAKAEYDPAILDFTKAIEADPSSAVGYMERGYAYADKGEHDLAIADYTKVIETDLVGGYYYRGQAYIRKAEYERAILDFTKVIEIQPNTVLGQASHYNLGCIYLKIGDTHSAQEHYDALKRLDENAANELLSRIQNMAEPSETQRL